MKTLKISLLTISAALIIFCGFSTDTFSANTVNQSVTSEIKKPGPKYVWVPGHYTFNKFGKRIWVPGHWKRV